MSRGYSKTMIIGNLGRDPQTRIVQTADGPRNLTEFSVAVGPIAGHTEWTDVAVWGPLADICSKYLKKGSLVHVEGRNRTSKWESDGHTFQKTVVVGLNVEFLDKREESSDAIPSGAWGQPPNDGAADFQSHQDVLF